MKCDLARPWVRGALKKNLIQELAENGEIIIEADGWSYKK